MGHVGNAVCNNLLRKGYNVTAMNDIKTENCRGFPDSIAVKNTAREVAEMSDIVVSGIFYVHFFGVNLLIFFSQVNVCVFLFIYCLFTYLLSLFFCATQYVVSYLFLRPLEKRQMTKSPILTIIIN